MPQKANAPDGDRGAAVSTFSGTSKNTEDVPAHSTPEFHPAQFIILDDRWRVRLEIESGRPDEEIERHGRMPLPPYIHRDEGAPPVDDRERYQTVYGRRPGAVAAPTAGLHFTAELLDRLRDRGVRVATLTLHVGLGTFQPVRAERAGSVPPIANVAGSNTSNGTQNATSQ